MTRNELVQLLKGEQIEDILETDIWRENEPLVICGFRTKNGYTVYLKSIQGSDSVELSINHPAEEAERKSFLDKLGTMNPGNFFDFNNRHLSLAEIRELVEQHGKKINANGWGANEISPNSIRIRFNE